MVKKVGVRVTGSYSWLDWADCMDRRMLMEESYRFLSDWWIDRCSMFDIYWNNPYYWTFSENIYMQIQSSTKWVIATLYFNAIRWLNIYIIIVAYSKLGHQVKKLSHKSVNQKKKKISFKNNWSQTKQRTKHVKVNCMDPVLCFLLFTAVTGVSHIHVSPPRVRWVQR